MYKSNINILNQLQYLDVKPNSVYFSSRVTSDGCVITHGSCHEDGTPNWSYLILIKIKQIEIKKQLKKNLYTSHGHHMFQQ